MNQNWNKDRLDWYLLDKKQRSVDVNEYLLLIDYINKIQPKVLIDIGTYKGTSGYILGTCCDSIENVISIDNIDSPDYCEKEETKKEEHGIFLPDGAIFLKDGYENNLTNLIRNPNETFIFWDAGKNTMKVMDQLKRSYDLKIKHIALHDSGGVQATVRRAIARAVRFKWYDIIEEDVTSCKEKGVTILELIELPIT
ncbi:MAG: hypothetical protein IMZ52_08120 [Actinobacteria bacterium]|nr:hypothetical protein [Actinomycetota bacterium]MBE3114619.1 hypothetical protein [Actinomycetota bacterium]